MTDRAPSETRNVHEARARLEHVAVLAGGALKPVCTPIKRIFVRFIVPCSTPLRSIACRSV